MKRNFFKYVAISAVLLTTAMNVQAQAYNFAGGVGTAKSVSGPDTNGDYTISLETFATGTTTVVTESVPSDVILVLDISSSMTSTGQYNGYANRLAALKASVVKFVGTIYDNDVTSTATDPSYAGNRIAIVTYNRNAKNVTSGWVDVGGNFNGGQAVRKNGNSYSGTLITEINNITQGSGTRPDHGLNLAINELLDGSPNTAREDANLTVLLFTDGYPTDNNASNWGEPEGRGHTNKFEYSFANKTLYYGSIVKQEYGAKLYTVGLISNVNRPNNPNTNTGDNGWMWRNYVRVQQMMDWLSSNYPDAKWADGAVNPNQINIENASSNGSYYNGYNNTDRVFKGNNIPVPWHNQWVFNAGNNAASDYVTLENFVPGIKDTEGDYSFIVDDNTSFDSIFESIANASGGSAAEVGSGTQVRDVVTNSFVLPDNVAAAQVKVYTSAATGAGDGGDTETDPPSWGTPVEITSSVTINIKNVDANGNPVETTGSNKALFVEGFDYSKDDTSEGAGDGNWVGQRYKNGRWFWAGKKLIIQFKVKADPNATGGAGSATNASTSGVYVKNDDGTYTAINKYEVPHTILTASITIKKTGLRQGESATFEIKRVRPKNWDESKSREENIAAMEYNIIGKPVPGTNWENFSKVILTNKTGPNGVEVTKKLVALDPYWVYKVEEDDWGWAYTLTGDTQQAIGGEYTTSSVEVNPFNFHNEEKTDVPKHAEAVTVNHFQGTESESYVEHYKSSKEEFPPTH